MTGIAVIYCRISADATEEGLGVQRQEQDCRELAQKHNMTVSHVYTDNDIGASDRSKKARPQYAAMLDAVRAGGIEYIIAYSNSRLTRRLKELEDLIQLHEQTGVEIHTFVSGNDDLSTEDGKMIARIKASVDAAEAGRTGERVKRAAKQRAEMGKPKHSRYRTYGYDADFKAVPEEAAVIRDAFDRVIRGESVSSIAFLWRDQGVTMGNGKVVHYSTVKHVVRRPLYAGLATYKGEVVGRSTAEPIVSEAVFYAAQDMLSQKSNPRSGKNARRYLLAGMTQCGECGHVMYGSHTYTNKSGNSRHSYICKPHMQGCGKVSVMGHHVDEMVLTLVKRRMTMADAVIEMEKVDYQPDINSIDEQMQAARSDVQNGLLTYLDIRDLLTDLSTRKRALERLVASQIKDTDFVPNKSWDEFKQASLSEQMATVGAVIQGVVVTSATSRKWNPSRVTIYTKSGNAINGKDIKSDVGDMRSFVAGFRDTPIKPTKVSRPTKGPNGKYNGSLPAEQ